MRLRPCRSIDELLEAASILSFYGRRERDRAWAEMWLENFDLDRMLAAFDEREIVGALGAFRFELSIPGQATLPARGLTLAGVLPTHRRRGIFSALVRRHLEDAHEGGEPLAYVIPASDPLFRRFGFGVATFAWEAVVPRDHARLDTPVEPVGRIRHVSVQAALDSFPAVYAGALAVRPGMFARPRAWWEFRTLQDPEYRRGGGGPAVRALLEIDGKPQAYAIYRLMPAATDPDTTEAVRVVEAVATSDRAEASLWRYLLGVDHVSTVEADLRIDHPLPLLLEEPRFSRFRRRHDAWLRIVDMGKALAARAYAGDGALVLDVRDSLCPWNTGTWRLEPGSAAQTTARAHLALDVADLASVLLGGVTFGDLRSVQRLDELQRGGVARADALFGRYFAPWCPQVF